MSYPCSPEPKAQGEVIACFPKVECSYHTKVGQMLKEKYRWFLLLIMSQIKPFLSLYIDTILPFKGNFFLIEV